MAAIHGNAATLTFTALTSKILIRATMVGYYQSVQSKCRSIHLKSASRHKAFNGWPLFWLIALPLLLVMVFEISSVDLSTGEGVSEMIGFSVRWAVPLLFLVMSISALQSLFPGPATLWLMRNRSYFGLCFAVAMAWQGLFIGIMSVIYRDYYNNEVFYLRDELEGSIGYIFLAAMVVTSFRFGRNIVSRQQWKLLHTAGLYFLWAYPFSVYWWNLSYYDGPTPLDYIYYWFGFCAFALRIAAWGKKRTKAAAMAAGAVGTPVSLRVAGALLIGVGVVIAATGRQWQDAVTSALTAPTWSAELLLWLPYWPFEPFLSLVLIGGGVWLGTTTRVELREPEAMSAQ